MILLTGATGKTGGETAKALVERGAKLRALVRDAEKASDLKAAGVDLVVGDVTDPATVSAALTGCEKALMVLPNGRRQLEFEKQFVDLAAKAGVRHLVKMSSMEAAPDAKAPIPQIHWASEEHLRASGMGSTMIRPNFFMHNLLGNAGTIKEQRKFFLPMGEGTTAMIDIRDIGAVTAEALAGSGHEGKSYDITGPEVLSFHDVADRFSEVLGEPVKYVDMPMDEYRQILGKFLTDEWHLNAVCELFGQIAEGGLEHKTDTFRELLDREPISLKQFIKEHVALFK